MEVQHDELREGPEGGRDGADQVVAAQVEDGELAEVAQPLWDRTSVAKDILYRAKLRSWFDT